MTIKSGIKTNFSINKERRNVRLTGLKAGLFRML